MSDPKLVQDLVEAFAEIPVIDAHEHLPPERVRVEQKVDAFTLFSHYTKLDQITAGLSPADQERVLNPELPLDDRWKLFAPILANIRYGSYARPAFIAAKEFYGFDDISEETYQPLSEAMAEANTAGIYQRILFEKCGIRAALTQAARTDYDHDFLVPLMPLDTYAAVRTWKAVANHAAQFGETVTTLDDYLSVVRKGLDRWKTERVVGLKMRAGPWGEPDRGKAHDLFIELRTGKAKQLPDMNPLRDFLQAAILDMAAEENLVVAVHTGMWGDFRTLDIHHMIPIVQRHPETRFDIYHAGMPRVREAGVIGKNSANVWLNLCWCHIISPMMTRSLLNEWIDLVPVNKILAFGGDYHLPVEKVYGHLLMARENIAHVLGARIDEGLMDRDEAVALATKWFYENPRALYGLDV